MRGHSRSVRNSAFLKPGGDGESRQWGLPPFWFDCRAIALQDIAHGFATTERSSGINRMGHCCDDTPAFVELAIAAGQGTVRWSRPR